MRRWLQVCTVGLGVILAIVASAAGATDFSLPEIEAEVMCPTCGTRLDLSHSPAADQIRAIIVAERSKGRSKSEVKALLVSQFGPSILAETPRSGSGAIAWIVPVGAGLAGLAAAVWLIRSWRRRGPPEGHGEPVVVDPVLDQRVDEALARRERNA